MDDLTLALRRHNELYYDKNAPEISDYQYDRTLQDLQKLEEQNPDLVHENSPTRRVGGSSRGGLETFRHTTPMLSIQNVYDRRELQDFNDRIRRKLGDVRYSYACELKFDGIAIALHYKKGSLARAVTRGDGVEGEVVTQNILPIASLPRKAGGDLAGLDFEVRGEVYMTFTDFEQSKSAYHLENERRRASGGDKPPAMLKIPANPRNFAGGSLKLKEEGRFGPRRLSCILYSLIRDKDPCRDHMSALDTLAKGSFNVSPEVRLCTSMEEVLAYVDEWEGRRGELDFQIDGVVIKVNEYDERELLGRTSKSPRWIVAYKYKPQEATTRLTGITYQVGRTGAITPVANLEPVLLGGTTVRRASLHNAHEFDRLGLCEGDLVVLIKGGEIIPKIIGVEESAREENPRKVQFIRECPGCGSRLNWDEGQAAHYCPATKHCPDQILGRMLHFVSRQAMDIDVLGVKTLKGLLRSGLVKSPADLYDLDYQKLLGVDVGMHEEGGSSRPLQHKTVLNILHGIEKSKTRPFETVLFALGIRHIGKPTSRILAEAFGTLESLRSSTLDQLRDIAQMGEQRARMVLDYFGDLDNSRLVDRLEAAGLSIEMERVKSGRIHPEISGRSFVISGLFESFSREELKSRLVELGGRVVSGLSASTDFLLAGNRAGSTKLEKAEKLGIKMLAETDVLGWLEDQDGT